MAGLGTARANRESNALISTGSKIITSRGNVLNLRGHTTNSAKEYAGRTPNIGYTLTRGILAYQNDIAKALFFQFNPDKIQDVKTTEYHDRSKPGQDYVDPIWIKGGSRVISFELVFDATQGSNTAMLLKPGEGKMLKDNPVDHENSSFIRGAAATHNPAKGTLEQVEFVQSLQRPDSGRDLEAKFALNGYVPTEKFFAPPTVIFSYGPLYFEGIIDSLSITHELFDKGLVPTRSRATLTFKCFESYEASFNNDLFGADPEPIEPFDFDTLGGTARPQVSSPIRTNL